MFSVNEMVCGHKTIAIGRIIGIEYEAEHISGGQNERRDSRATEVANRFGRIDAGRFIDIAIVNGERIEIASVRSF